MKILSSIPITTVWSGHPVRFDLLTHKRHQFIAFYDAQRKMTVGQRILGETEFSLHRLTGKWLEARGRLTTDIAWDSHNSVTMAIDRDDQIHLCGNMHVDPLIYFRTTRPLDISSLERVDYMVGENEDRCTYPVFMRGPNGELIFRFRDGSSGNGVDYYNQYDEADGTWRRLVDVPILDGMDAMNAYARMPELGPDNQYHMVWMWRDTPDCATNHDISYARSRDLVRWEAGNGHPLPLPITVQATASIVDPVAVGGGLINMCQSLGFDAAQRPIVSYHKHDDNGHTQAYAARLEKGRWVIYKLSNWDYRWEFGGGGSIGAEIRLGGAKACEDGFLSMSWWHLKKGSGVWKLDEAALEVVGVYPEPLPELPLELSQAKLDYPGMAVRTASGRVTNEAGVEGGVDRYLLRWETLGANRDRPRDEIPPPSQLWLHGLGCGG
ncbi:MAG: hypothetical protein GKR89_23445 [Candidatus Latescibacteria bacterium]|nr:hypothetical protein [Candidatus Latescibacterota bacterium]